MTTIGYDSIENILLSISDPNTWGAMTQVPWVSSPKINAWTSIYNEQWGWDWQWIAWWSTDISWTPWVWTISWTSGNLSLPDWTQVSVSSWSASISAPTYIYCDTTDWTVHSTTHSYEAVWENKIMICAAFPNSWKNVTFKAFWCADQNSAVTWADIAAGTIVASNIASNTITANNIASWTITANEIASNTITASEMNVSRLSAISANLWDITAGTITGTTITAWSTSSSAIKLYPYSSTQWRIDFYYNWSVIGYMYWDYVSSAWWGLIRLHGNNLLLDWTTYMLSRNRLDLSQGKLRVPVWTNLY